MVGYKLNSYTQYPLNALIFMWRIFLSNFQVMTFTTIIMRARLDCVIFRGSKFCIKYKSRSSSSNSEAQSRSHSRSKHTKKVSIQVHTNPRILYQAATRTKRLQRVIADRITMTTSTALKTINMQIWASTMMLKQEHQQQ